MPNPTTLPAPAPALWRVAGHFVLFVVRFPVFSALTEGHPLGRLARNCVLCVLGFPVFETLTLPPT
jgi:hypothetical protein